MMFLKRYSKFFACFGIIFCLLSFVPQSAYAQVPFPGVNPLTRWLVGVTVGADTNSCSLVALHNCFYSLLDWFAQVWITFLGWGLAMAGFILNSTIDITILNLKTVVATDSIAAIWTIIRDLVNIGMIFMVLYIAILTIVQANASATKKMLGGVIFVAIFVNFSLFTTKFLIDASNRVTLVFYNAIVSEGQNAGNHTNTNTDSLGGSIAGIVLNQLNLKTFYKSGISFEENVKGIAAGQASAATPQRGSKPGSLAISLIGGSIYIVVAIYTFLAISIMLIIRFATLILLLVFSPAGFLLGVTSGLNNNWWKELWKNLLFPPAMFLMLWVSIYTLNTLINTTPTGDDWFSAITNMSYVTSSLFVKFFLAIVLLLASMIIANKIGATGAAQLQSWVNKSSKSMLGGWAGNIAGFAGRNTLGWAGRKAGNFYDNQIGNKLFTRSETLKNISSDPKNNRLLRFGAGALGNVVGGINTLGTRTVRSGLAQVEGGKYGSTRSLKEEEDLLRKEKFTQRAVEERIQNEEYVKQYGELQKKRDEIEITDNGITRSIGDLIKIEEAAAKAEKDRSEDEIEALESFKREAGIAKDEEVARRIDGFRKERDEKVQEHYKNEKVIDRAGKEVAMADIAKKFSKLGDKDIEMMLEENPSLATDSKFLRLLSPDQVKGLTKREGVTAAEIGEIKKAYKNEMVSTSRSGMFGRMNAIGTGELTGGMDAEAFAAFFESSINSGIASGKLSDRINGNMLSAAYSNITDANARRAIDTTSQRLFESAGDKIHRTDSETRPFEVNDSVTDAKEKAHLNKIATMMNWYHREMAQGNSSYDGIDLSIIKSKP